MAVSKCFAGAGRDFSSADLEWWLFATYSADAKEENETDRTRLHHPV
jgi:hypothetical protein